LFKSSLFLIKSNRHKDDVGVFNFFPKQFLATLDERKRLSLLLSRHLSNLSQKFDIDFKKKCYVLCNVENHVAENQDAENQSVKPHYVE
jgi:hypothetical protein